MTTTTKRTRKRPTMTAEQARRFERYSVHSVTQILAQLECDCVPYEDTYTYNRWRAQGFAVRRGERGIRFSTFVPVTNEDGEEEFELDEDGELKRRLVVRRLVVFCRCQVEPIR